MENRNNNFLQKVKENAFYVALVLGLFAILAVVAIYTVDQSGEQMVEQEIDLNMASDDLGTEQEEIKDIEVEKVDSDDEGQAAIKETNAKTANQVNKMEKMEEKEEYLPITEEHKQKVMEEKDPIPVTSNPGELDFNSEKVLAWPIEGKVILPYSMETTVYFKTLDLYRCNPGMLIAAGNGTTVKNAYLGKVTKVTSDNTYGNMVTLYLGNNYSVVYGQLDMVYVKEGDFVRAGESIGTIGNPTDTFVKEGSHLFFQMLEKDKEIDPMLFMKE